MDDRIERRIELKAPISRVFPVTAALKHSAETMAVGQNK
jgi:hypothetical protein